jgi:hypothetical protein
VPIKAGVYGEMSKIQEELDEAIDAESQGQTLLLMIELSDIIGAVAGVAEKHGTSLEALVQFSELVRKSRRTRLEGSDHAKESET